VKVGDLVKWPGWKNPVLIVHVYGEISYPEARRNNYCRCLVGDGCITLLESQLELINESR